MSLPHMSYDDGSYMVLLNNKAYRFDKGHLSYSPLKECIQAEDAEEFIKFFDGRAAVEDFTDGDFAVRGETLFYKGKECHKSISTRVIQMMKENFDYTPMFNFLTRLYKNPSMRAVLELFEFMVHQGLVITNEGFLLAYKGIKVHRGNEFFDVLGNLVQDGDYVDAHTGCTYRYNPGDVIEMPRNEVCDDSLRACGAGLHCGSPQYSLNWAEKPVIVKVDPADVVSIPLDCSCQKMRCCKLEVVSEFEQVFDKVVHKLENETEDRIEDDFEDDFEDEDEEMEPECECCGYPEYGCECCVDCYEYPCVCDDFKLTWGRNQCQGNIQEDEDVYF